MQDALVSNSGISRDVHSSMLMESMLSPRSHQRRPLDHFTACERPHLRAEPFTLHYFFDVLVSYRFILPFFPEMNAGRRHHNVFMAGLWVLNIFTYINATFNFVVYYTMGSRYREAFWALFGRKSSKSKSKENPEISTVLTTIS